MSDARAPSRLVAGAATAVAQVLTMAGSSLLGLLIARKFGSSPATDGFFAANTVYGIALFASQSLRTTAPASLVAERAGALRAHARAVGLLVLAVIVLFVVIASAANALLPGEAGSTLRTAMIILAPAAVAQLYAGLLAARCAVLGSFVLPALAYALGTVVMAIAFLAIEAPLGVEAIPAAVTVGALVGATTMGAAWWRAERRAETVPVDELAAPPATVRTLTARLLRGAVPVLASQVVISTSTFAAGHTGAGNGTLYTYGMLAVGVLTAIVASPVSIVLAADVARTWDRRPASLVPLVAGTFRLGAVLLPALAITILLLGPPPARFVMTALSPGDVDQAFLIAAITTPAVLSTLLSMVPMVASIAEDSVGRVGRWSFVVAALHAVTAVVIATTGSLTLLAVETLVAATALSLVPVIIVLRGSTGDALRAVARAGATLVLPGPVAALAVWLVLGGETTVAQGLIAAATGLGVHAVVVLGFARGDVSALLPAGLRGRRAT